MEFLKKHYEKLLLGAVLIGLAAAVVFLQFVVSSEKQKLVDLTESVLHPNVKPLTNINLTAAEASLKRLATPAVIDFGGPQRVFNPMPWQKAGDRLIPIDKVGPSRLVVTNIVPLWLRLSLQPQVTASDSGFKYIVSIEDEVSRTKRSTVCTANPPTKDKTFTMLEVKGKPEDPTELVVEMNDTKEKAIIGKDKPFERVDGYKADFYYDLEKNKSWLGRRVGATLPFNGEDYKIVAISKNEAVLSAPNQKKWTIKANPNATSETAPEPR